MKGLGLNRREFLGTTLGWAAGTAAAAAPAPGAPLLIDTHTHFYDPARPQGVPWPPKNDPVLYRTVLPGNYPLLGGPRPVAGTVVVEASPWVEDNQWVLDLAAREKFIAGLVGSLPLGAPECAALIDRFAANPLFRGLRIRGMPLEGALGNDALIADLRRLADKGLSLDLVGNAAVHPFADGLAARIPALRIVLDHLPGLKLEGGPIAKDWIDAMSALAKRPNIFIKVSGLVEATGKRGGAAPRDPEFYRPALDIIWEAFGPGRLLYGSNWPVCEHYAPIDAVQRIAFEYFSAKGPEAVAKVFSGTAKAAYRWVER